jgi:hypothetical protein
LASAASRQAANTFEQAVRGNKVTKKLLRQIADQNATSSG